ncbi:MAG: 50S ribosomal protein L4 [Legionellales bacterium]|nr:50S ribosomal protein L4 [Legionellales bacterium]OUX64310.1 MAG: 50S ribosomal protein L4 [Gammaproteobacteria bacterium TMED281]
MKDKILEIPFNQNLVHQILVSYQSNGRAWSKSTKNRSEVSGGGKKPWRQKGTGRARAGTSRGPLWRGGGVTFAHNSVKKVQKINKKMYRKAMLTIIAELKRTERLHIIEEIKLKTHKTKDFLELFKDRDLTKTVFIVDKYTENLDRATGNLFYINIALPESIDPITLCNSHQVLVEKEAYDRLIERFTNE